MSGLEKFQASEAWRTNFKKFIFMERKPEVVQNTSTITESQRYSLDIGDDLKNIIEQKKNKKTVQINLKEEIINIPNTLNEKQYQQEKTNQILKDNEINKENMNRCNETVYGELSMWQKTSDESFEALEKMCEKTVSDPNSTLFKYLNGEDEEQKSNNAVAWQKTSDESFEALERMCDKTASDPNSTLFQYLHSDRKEQVLAQVKKRSADGNNQKQEDLLLMKLNNCTLLDDVEAPSRMWENTICGDTILQTSPIKMVGLLRPSTIIEEAPDDSTNSEVSSQMSFRTATKGAHSDVSSSAYETAHDSTAASNRTDISNKICHQELEVIDVDHIVFSGFETHESLIKEINNEAKNIPSLEIMDATITESTQRENNCEEKHSKTNDISVDLIDLEKTFGPLHNSPHSSILVDELDEGEEEDEQQNDKCKESEIEEENNVLDDSVIEILSDDDEDVEEDNDDDLDFNKQQILYTNIKTENYSESSSLSINQDTYSFNESTENDKENCGDTREPSDKSMQFNDTMEEVEYMLKKGIEYMAAEAAAAKKSPTKVNSSMVARQISVTKTQPNSPITNKKPRIPISSSASKVKSSTYTTPAKKTPLSKGPSSTSKRFDIDIKPFPKLDIFAKPPMHARTKELTSKQQKFSHVVSPIGTYMKKTAKTPLMSSINCKNRDYFNSTAILELENESRLYQPQFAKDSNVCQESGLRKLPGLPSGTKRPLPKKAYISSDLKHIVDERTPVTIPGGKKIQKYLENAMMPAVLRHEGKFKMPGNVSNKLNTPTSSSKFPLKDSDTNSTITGRSSSHIPRRNNASLADLSVMSGDVSMYTIMDAQKF